MRTAVLLKLPEISNEEANCEYGGDLPKAIIGPEPVPPEPIGIQTAEAGSPKARQLISSKELSKRWDIPESTLRYWRCAGIGLPYIKLGGRIKCRCRTLRQGQQANTVRAGTWRVKAMALFKRGDFFHYHFWVNGKRYRGSTKRTTMAAARQVEYRLIATAETEGGLTPRRRSPILREFESRFFDWVEQSKLAEKSKIYYRNGWRLLAETEVASMRLDAVTRDDAERLKFSGGASNHNNALRTLRRMLGKAVEWKLLRAAPKIKLLVENERKRMIDGPTEAKLLPFLKQPLRDVLMIMRDSGMRNHKEIFVMRWEYVDWANDRYYVYASKSPKGRRYVPLSPRVTRALLVRCKGQKQGWVFPSKRARCGHVTTVSKAFQKARAKADLPKD